MLATYRLKIEPKMLMSNLINSAAMEVCQALKDLQELDENMLPYGREQNKPRQEPKPLNNHTGTNGYIFYKSMPGPIQSMSERRSPFAERCTERPIYF